MKFRNPEIDRLFDYLSTKSREAYKDPFLISNVVLSKQETCGKVLENYLANTTPKEITLLFSVKKLVLYFVKNLAGFFLYILSTLAHRLSGQKFHLQETGECLILDTYFQVGDILNRGRMEDTYFPGLSKVLIKRNKTHVYVPRLIGSNQFFDLFRAFRILKKINAPVLTEFQIARFVDYLDAARFLFFYPFSFFRFIKKLGSNYEDKILRYGLWQTLDGVILGGYMRYLLGKRLASMNTGGIKCLSWYENVVAEKNFYRGLRAYSKKLEIIGVQSFVRPYSLLNIVPDESEIPFGVVPDKVLVNGPGYLFQSNRLHVGVGPSLRYRHIFNTNVQASSGEIVLVLLSCWDHVNKYIIETIRDIDWPIPVEIKLHSTLDWKKYKINIPEKFKMTKESFPRLLPRVRIAVGRSTGALIEAAALGIPVIDINHPDEFSHCYMPKIGKGILWDQASSAEEVARIVRQFEEALRTDPTQLKKEGARLRSFCFCEPTEELIGHALGLD